MPPQSHQPQQAQPQPQHCMPDRPKSRLSGLSSKIKHRVAKHHAQPSVQLRLQGIIKWKARNKPGALWLPAMASSKAKKRDEQAKALAAQQQKDASGVPPRPSSIGRSHMEMASAKSSAGCSLLGHPQPLAQLERGWRCSHSLMAHSFAPRSPSS